MDQDQCKHNSSRIEILPALNMGTLVQNKLCSLLVIVLKKAKAHTEVEPKRVDTCYGIKPYKIPFKTIRTLSCTTNHLMPLSTKGNNHNLGIKKGLITIIYCHRCYPEYNNSSDKLLAWGTPPLHLLPRLYISSIISEVRSSLALPSKLPPPTYLLYILLKWEGGQKYTSSLEHYPS